MKKLQCHKRVAAVASKRLITWVLALFCGLTGTLTMAQERFLIEGIFDAELYDTDANSKLLAKNEGDPSAVARLQIWSAFQISPGLQLYALGEFEVENSSGSRETEKEIEQLALRYSSRSSPYYFIEVGKLLSPIGAFTTRHLSTRNPLIGQANTHITSYPWGIQAAGSSQRFDYRAALLDLPDTNSNFVPENPGSAFRPALGLGVTLFTGLRFGASYTEGPYLSPQLEAFLPPGAHWRDFDQRLRGFDVQFSRGYLELDGELVFSEYDVPFHQESIDATAYYVELKYTWTPRFYGAVRFEKNESANISHTGGLSWSAQVVDFYDVEIGLGYRFGPNTQIKIAYRRDHWNGDSALENSYSNGHSLSLQLSHHFDLKSWFVKN